MCFKNHSYFQILENLISIATLIRAYLVEKNCQVNSRSYTFIRDCRVGSTNRDHNGLLIVYNLEKDGVI